jgi:flagellar biosynthesis chaperone FliJ
VAAASATKSKGNDDPGSSRIHDLEHTILNLRLVVEKQNAENKYLRNAKSRASATTAYNVAPATLAYMSASDRKKEEIFEKLKSEYEKLQKSYNELLGKNSRLQIELELSQVQTQTISASCPHCDQKNMDELASHDVDTLRQKLQQRDVVLDKAKFLVTRSLAKERQLRETVANLKKKICELEGVPVISEENSESGGT